MATIPVNREIHFHTMASFVANVWYEGEEFARGAIRFAHFDVQRKVMRQKILHDKTRAIVMYDRVYQKLSNSIEE